MVYLKSAFINGKEFPVVGHDDFNFSGRKDCEVKEFGMDEFRQSSQIDSMSDEVGSTELRLDGFETRKLSYFTISNSE